MPGLESAGGPRSAVSFDERARRPARAGPGGPAAARSSRAALVLLLVTVLARLPFLFDAVINWDESTFLLMGEDLLRGRLPYVHAWDNKPPLVFIPYAAALAIFGDNVVGARILGIAAVFAGALLVRRAARRVIGRRGADWAAVLLVLFSGAPPGSFAAMSEHIALPFFCLALDRMLAGGSSRRSFFATGVLLGLMVLVRTNLAYAALGFLLAVRILSPAGASARAISLAAGALVPPLITAAVYAAAGRLDLFVRSVVVAPLAYAESGWLSGVETLSRMARFGLRAEVLPLVLAALAGAFLLVRDARRGRTSARGLVALALLLALTALSTAGSGRYFGHYAIQFLPFAAIAAGRACAPISTALLRPLLAVLFLVPAWPSIARYPDFAAGLARGDVFTGPAYSIAEFLSERGARGEYAYFTELHVLYLLTGAERPTRFVHPALIVNEPILRAIDGPEATTRAEILSIFEKRPRFVVARDEIFYLERRPEARKLLGEILAGDYEEAERIESYRIYSRRKTGHAPPGALSPVGGKEPERVP